MFAAGVAAGGACPGWAELGGPCAAGVDVRSNKPCSVWLNEDVINFRRRVGFGLFRRCMCASECSGKLLQPSGGSWRRGGGVVALVVAGLVPMGASAQPSGASVAVETPEAGHAEVMLVGGSGVRLKTDAVADLSVLVQRDGFLDTPSTATADPLAPCALVAAVVSAASLNMVFAGLMQPTAAPVFPPPNTRLFGEYDAYVRQGNRSIPRENPVIAANIAARTIVWRSWGWSTNLNTLLAPLTQRQCLALLSDMPALGKALSQPASTSLVLTHAAPVSAYIGSYPRESAERYFADLAQGAFYGQVQGTSTNPLAPCSLLNALRLASRLNRSYQDAQSGQFNAEEHAALAPYAQEIRAVAPLKVQQPRSAELWAALFAAEITRSNELSGQLMQGATEQQCLAEIYAPGQLRARLLQQGITLPLR